MRAPLPTQRPWLWSPMIRCRRFASAPCHLKEQQSSVGTTPGDAARGHIAVGAGRTMGRYILCVELCAIGAAHVCEVPAVLLPGDAGVLARNLMVLDEHVVASLDPADHEPA